MADETSVWEKHGLEAKVTSILEGVTSQGHHFGRPYLTAYQLAIALAERYPDTFRALGKPVGGAGTGQQTSLTQYLAGQLSRSIKAGRIKHIEGAFLSHLGIVELVFRHGEETLRSSMDETGSYDLSMFRLRDEG